MLSRRELLAASGAFALGIPSLARTAQMERLILGASEFQYEWVDDWLTPPSWISYGDTHGVAQDSCGNIYVAHTVNGRSAFGQAVCVFDENGKYLRSWGEQFRGGAHGLDLRREGASEFLYHCDTAHRKVVKTDLDGKEIWTLEAPKESGRYEKGEPFIPTNVAFSPNGDFYVADGYGSNWIHQYDRKANYIRTFGGPGRDPGQVQQPHGLWLDDRGKEPLLAVADRANHRIQYFSLDGKHVSFSTDGMRLPCHFSIQKGVMLVPDLSSVITLLDEDNKPIVQLGDGNPTNLRDHPRKDFVRGKFVHPHDAMFLRNGDILVAEWVPIGRVTLLRRVQ